MSFNPLATVHSRQNKGLNANRVPLVSHEGDFSPPRRAHVCCIWMHEG